VSFNPQDHLMKLQGRDYLPVNARLAWLNDKHASFRIATILDDAGEEVKATAEVTILKDDGSVLKSATGTKSARKGSFKGGTHEKVETGAIGRALGMLGFGTLQTDDFDEDPEVMGGVSDSPVERKQPAPRPAPAPAPKAQPAPAAGEFAPYDHDSLADDDVLSTPKVKRVFAIGSKLWPDLKGDALEKRLLAAASKIVKADVLNLHRLQWRDGNDVMKKLEEEAVSRGVWGEAK
jgi:hypothetical protein